MTGISPAGGKDVQGGIALTCECTCTLDLEGERLHCGNERRIYLPELTRETILVSVNLPQSLPEYFCNGRVEGPVTA